MMVLAQQEASQRKTRDLSRMDGVGELRSQGFGQFMTSFKSQEQMLKHKRIEDNKMQKAKKIIAQ